MFSRGFKMCSQSSVPLNMFPSLLCVFSMVCKIQQILYCSMCFFSLYSLEAFLFLFTWEEFHKYITGAHLSLEFKKKKALSLFKILLPKIFSVYAVLSREFDYPFSERDGNKLKKTLGSALEISSF